MTDTILRLLRDNGIIYRSELVKRKTKCKFDKKKKRICKARKFVYSLKFTTSKGFTKKNQLVTNINWKQKINDKILSLSPTIQFIDQVLVTKYNSVTQELLMFFCPIMESSNFVRLWKT